MALRAYKANLFSLFPLKKGKIMNMKLDAEEWNRAYGPEVLKLMLNFTDSLPLPLTLENTFQANSKELCL